MPVDRLGATSDRIRQTADAHCAVLARRHHEVEEQTFVPGAPPELLQICVRVIFTWLQIKRGTSIALPPRHS